MALRDNLGVHPNDGKVDELIVDELIADRRFTGQREDGTGLVYMNARYYDPAIGQFISPDTIVPDPGRVFGYNRYMYGYGNPLEYSDPSGHCATNSTREHRAANCHDYPALLWHKGTTQKGKPLCLFFD